MKKLLVEYFRIDGSPLTLLDLGSGHLHAQGIPLSNAMRPLRDEVDPIRSQRGKLYFDFERARLPLPDLLETRIRINGIDVAMGETRKTASGNSYREGTVAIKAEGISFDVSVYMSLSQRWCWLRVRASGLVVEARQIQVRDESPISSKQLALHKAAWLHDDEQGRSNVNEVPDPGFRAKSQNQPTTNQSKLHSSRLDQVESRLADLAHRFEKLEQRLRTIEMIILARDSIK